MRFALYLEIQIQAYINKCREIVTEICSNGEPKFLICPTELSNKIYRIVREHQTKFYQRSSQEEGIPKDVVVFLMNAIFAKLRNLIREPKRENTSHVSIKNFYY